MKLYIDFDGTLFNSTEFYLKFIDIFKKHKLKEEYIKYFLNKEYEKEKNYDKIAKKLIKDNNLNDEIIEEINKLYSEKLIFKDAKLFLEKYYKKYTLILLTLGEYKYQLKKINSSKINKYFKDIIITNKDKSKLNINYSEGIFIDNNPLELKRFYKANANKLIRIKRDSDKYSKLNLDINNIPEFKNFEELLHSNYIDEIGEKQYE